MSGPVWPVWQPDEPRQPEDAASPTGPRCPNCSQPIDPAAAFCEACGSTLIPTAAAPLAAMPTSSGSQQTRRLGVRQSQLATCPSCGGTIDADGYCQICGAKAPSERDHYTEQPAAWVAGVCDRGVRHARNEDAMALWADDDRAVLVVCDGVSTSIDSDAASTTAARTIRDLLVERLADISDADQTEAHLAAALVEAAAAANAAISAETPVDTTNAASATLAAAVVVNGEVHYANLGDSRVYYLGTAGSQLLSLDDSLAQAFIAEGMSRAEAEALPRAHAITKWLGRDAPDIVPRTGVHRIAEAGWLVVCSDGLWNYASEAEALHEQLAAASVDGSDPADVAGRLVAWANGRGGHDNVTVALARCSGLVRPTTLDLTTTSLPHAEEHPEHG